MLRENETILNGKYRIVRLIGQGGMARAWLAEEVAFGRRPVVLKEPRSDLSLSEREQVWRRFQREIEIGAILAQAGVPHVVRALTAEPYEDGLLLVLEYMAGGDLTTLLKEHPQGLPIAQAVRIAGQVLAALAAVHSLPQEIVHRDISPGNILLDAAGQAYLGDFGLAQVLGEILTQLLGGPVVGKPLYAAPEQLRGTAGYLTPAADLYALGCVLFEMLTGKRYKRVRPGTRASELRAEVPGWLDEALARALAEDPWERWETAEEMAKALTPCPHPPLPQSGVGMAEGVALSPSKGRGEGGRVPPPAAGAVGEGVRAPRVAPPVAVIERPLPTAPGQPKPETPPPEPDWGTWVFWVWMTILGVAVGWAVGWAGYWIVEMPVFWLVVGAGVGFGQWLVLRRHFRRAGGWIPASTINEWEIGKSTSWISSAGRWILAIAIVWAVGWGVIGDVVGDPVVMTMGWPVVGAVDRTWRYGRSLCSSVMTVGWPVVGAVGWAVIGAGIGFGQWLVLRRHFRQAGWWILANTTGWAVGGAVGGPVFEAVGGAVGQVVGGAVGGAVIGAIAGGLTGAVLVWILRQPRLDVHPTNTARIHE